MTTNLAEILSQQLHEKGLILTTAESCTSGMVATAITDISGSSNIFDRGFITYSNQAKQDMLNVPAKILNAHGAVSAQCAQAMAQGALNNSNATIAVSVTGIAGPNGGSASKPVGLVYIGTYIKELEPAIEECHFSGNREEIRKQARDKALSLLIDATFTI